MVKISIQRLPSSDVGPARVLQEPPVTCLVLSICHSTGKKFENSEMFGQYPLQVNGFKDLHECLEAAMNEGEIESLSAENSTRSGQEVSAKPAYQHDLRRNTGGEMGFCTSIREIPHLSDNQCCSF